MAGVLSEVKCRHRCESISIRAAAVHSSFCLAITEDELHLKHHHQYYYQVQHGLMVTGYQWAEFVVWTPSELFIERLDRDDDLINSIRPKMKSFFHQHLLPALVAEDVRSLPTAPKKAIYELSLHRVHGVNCYFFPSEISQSRILMAETR